MSGGADVVLGATGDGTGVGIEGETGADDGVNAGVVTGSSPLDVDVWDERECLAVGDAEACRPLDFAAAVAGLAAAAGVGLAGGVVAAPVCSGCGVGMGVGTESVAVAGVGWAWAMGSEPMGSVVLLLPAWTRFQAPSPTAMMARMVAIIPVMAARLRDFSWRPVMVTGSSK